jgi:uncharacterized protein (DUF1778 family)
MEELHSRRYYMRGGFMTLRNKLTFRVSSKEKRLIKQEAKKANERTLSDYIRKIIATYVRRENEQATR